jgi:hypothetical protein
MRNGSTEEGHHGVADELLNSPAKVLEFGAHPLVERNKRGAHVLRVAPVGLRGRADEVGKEHGHHLAFLASARNLIDPSAAAGTEPRSRRKLDPTCPARCHTGHNRTCPVEQHPSQCPGASDAVPETLDRAAAV